MRRHNCACSPANFGKVLYTGHSNSGRSNYGSAGIPEVVYFQVAEAPEFRYDYTLPPLKTGFQRYGMWKQH